MNIDKVSEISQNAKERLFAKMDTLKIGVVSFDQFKTLFSESNAKLRKEADDINSNDIEPKIKDSFEWEQGIIQDIRNWIKSKNYTVTEAFKIFD